MNFSSTFPNMTSPDELKTLLFGIGYRNMFQFTIGQPEDPRWKDSNETRFGRVVDSGSPFYLVGHLDKIKYSAQSREASRDESRSAKDRNWRLGVGLGVRLGVPLITLVAFFCGKAAGQKSKKPTQEAKQVAQD